MKYLTNLTKSHVVIILGLCILVSLLLHMQAPHFPCFNSDEASFTYNAYSILKTGKDEYGKFLPVRFEAFGEHKLPVTIYSIVPFIGIFGLNETAARLPFIALGIAMPLLFYWLAKNMFKNIPIACLAAILASFSPWIQIMSRHIHENIIILALTIFISYLLIKLTNKHSYRLVIALALVTGISLFTYHIGKLLALFVCGWLLVILFQNSSSKTRIIKSFFIVLVPLMLFGLTEFMQPSSRINNLLFTSTPGFPLTIESLRSEHDSRLLHNKVTHGIRVISDQYLAYFSPEFLVSKGDHNDRFGSPGISPISPVEYVFFFIGIGFIFFNKEKYRALLISLLLISPLTAALSWQIGSLTRSYIMIVPLLLLSAYGMYWTVKSINKRIISIFLAIGSIVFLFFFTYMSWDFYFNHYPKRISTTRAWQCGYKELVSYIDTNYDTTDQYYITKRHGQPYIFTLFYLGFPPHKYQPQANLSELGEYGFGEVESYDKFVFSFQSLDAETQARTSYIGYPEDFNGTGITKDQVKTITINKEDIFWIYERNK